MMKSRNRAQFLRVLVLVGAAVSTGHLWVAQGEPDSSSLLSSAIQTPSWASKLCAYGTLPGTWLESPQRPEDKPPPANHPQLLDKPGSEVGGRYRLLPNRGQCQLQNRLKQYLFPSPEHPEISLGRPLRVLSLGDSVDGQTEENICWMDALHDGRNSTTYVDADGRDYYTTLTPECTQQQQQQQQPGGARLSCLTQPTHTKTNLCITSRVHMYQRVVISLQPTFNETLFGDEWGFRGLPALVNETRDFVLRNSGAEDMDMVILGVHFWELAHLVDDTRPVEGIDGTTVPLPLSYLEAHMRRYSDFIALVRRAFPTALIVMRTNTFPLHTWDGKPEGRSWSHRMWVEQMNGATRAVAQLHHLPLVDFGAIGNGFVPSQVMMDSHHPLQWFSVEMLNVALNYFHDFAQLRELHHHAAAKSASRAAARRRAASMKRSRR